MEIGKVFRTEDGYAKIVKDYFFHPDDDKVYYSLAVRCCDSSGRFDVTVIPKEIVFFDNWIYEESALNKLYEKYRKKRNASDQGLVVQYLRDHGWDARAIKDKYGEIYHVDVNCFWCNNRHKTKETYNHHNYYGDYESRARQFIRYLFEWYVPTQDYEEQKRKEIIK